MCFNVANVLVFYLVNLFQNVKYQQSFFVVVVGLPPEAESEER